MINLMFKSLRNRLIFSHILPLLVIIPLMGAALLYAFETRIYLPSLADSLESNAYYLADILNRSTPVWSQPGAAQSLLEQSIRNQSGLNNTARLMLVSPQGQLLASTDRTDLPHLGDYLDLPQLSEVRQGHPSAQVVYSTRADADVIDVIVPVISPEGLLLGAVRMTYRYATFADEFDQVRTLISILLVVGLVSGSLLGYLLAVSIVRPIRRVTQAVDQLAHSGSMTEVSISGPQEVETLANTFNFMVARLRELERSRRLLLANLVHELGRPLGALRSAIQALGQGAEKDPALYHELVEGMNEETARLQHLLNELAELHDQVLGTLELDCQPINLKEWLPGVLRTWQEAATENRLHWDVQMIDPLPALTADPLRLAQIVGNLVSNAIKFTPTGGSITITAQAHLQDGLADGKTEITVTDSGPGVPPDEQEKIFTPFYRGVRGKRFPQGMGLGLSIARDLTLAHGGRLELESTPGMGSAFRLIL